MIVTENNNSTNKFSELWHLVSNTPMLKLRYYFKGRPGCIYIKCEHYNLTGSVKDRMVLYIMKQAYQQGLIKPADRIVEVTGGNTPFYVLLDPSSEHPWWSPKVLITV